MQNIGLMDQLSESLTGLSTHSPQIGAHSVQLFYNIIMKTLVMDRQQQFYTYWQIHEN